METHLITKPASVKVQYTVKTEFAERNKQNIRNIMDKLREINNPAIRYISLLMEDQKTFISFLLFNNAEAEKELTNLEVFKVFRAELKASDPEIPPKVEHLSFVASSYEIF